MSYRVAVCIIILCTFSLRVETIWNHTIPEITIQALWPKGLRVFIVDSPNISEFYFAGTYYSKISGNFAGYIIKKITEPTNGKWVAEELDQRLVVGDQIDSVIVVKAKDGSRYSNRDLLFTVKEFIDVYNEDSTCKPTPTYLRDRNPCAGEVLFEDDFNFLSDYHWELEQYIPEENGHPFVSYQRKNSVLFVSDGILRIKPQLLQQERGFTFIKTGTLDLIRGCTSMTCKIDAFGPFILPPVISAKLTMKNMAFTYGVVEIRAKFPKGDWLYPDILMEPLIKRYGTLNLASGLIRIAGALGNRNLTSGNKDVSNKVLYGGPIMDLKCRKTLIATKKSKKFWGDDFHTYILHWSTDKIKFMVDGEEWASFSTRSKGLDERFDKNCKLPTSLLSSGTMLSPFDDFFYLTLGVGVGGVTEFDDNVVSDGRRKPWKNDSPKACAYFWKNKEKWLSTWDDNELLVDYVRVRAL